MAYTHPPEAARDLDPARGPLLIDWRMMSALRSDMTALVEAVPSPAARAEGLARMQFPRTELAQAAHLPGSAVHDEVAAMLCPVVAALL